MDAMTDFFEDLKDSIREDTFSAAVGRVSRRSGDKLDVQAKGLPLLINLPILMVKEKDYMMDSHIKVGDTVLVVFNEGNISDGYVVGAVGSNNYTWEKYIKEVMAPEIARLDSRIDSLSGEVSSLASRVSSLESEIASLKASD